ncbi:MAG: benzoate-CoA ligase family protein [Myxococcaceae bacterium]|nr:benzoate-CoA ligase family protein [Myxococcaceae bacterium]
MSLDPFALPETLNLAEFFLHAQARQHPTRPALYCGDDTVTYGALAEQVNRTAGLLRTLGLESEQRVLLAMPDTPEFAYAWFAAVQVGGVVSAINPDTKAEELEYFLNYTRARVLFADGITLPALAQVRARCPHLKRVLVSRGAHGGDLDFAAERARTPPDPAIAATHRDDTAVWLYTSGSTGFPKAAVHKQHDFVFNALTYALPVAGYRASDKCLSVPRLAFGYALGTNLLFPLLAGGSAVLFPEKPTPDVLFAHLKKHRPTFLTLVPTSLNQMLGHPQLESVDFSSVRVALSAGEALPPELYLRWKERTKVEVLDGIGSAEMFHIFISNHEGDVVPGSLGKVVKGYEAKVCDDDGAEVPRGEVGTLWIRGDSMALEYWQQHEKSKQTFRGDWCVSADKFRQDENGYFWFCGRGDELLKVGGKWLAPIEVENALLQHPAVKEAAVVGFKDQDGLEKPKAFVALNAGHAAGSALEKALQEHVRAKLAPFKAPRQVVFVDALPRSDRGKVLKGQLRG